MQKAGLQVSLKVGGYEGHGAGKGTDVLAFAPTPSFDSSLDCGTRWTFLSVWNVWLPHVSALIHRANGEVCVRLSR